VKVEGRPGRVAVEHVLPECQELIVSTP
jgi:hypothetical protein